MTSDRCPLRSQNLLAQLTSRTTRDQSSPCSKQSISVPRNRCYPTTSSTTANTTNTTTTTTTTTTITQYNY